MIFEGFKERAGNGNSFADFKKETVCVQLTKHSHV